MQTMGIGQAGSARAVAASGAGAIAMAFGMKGRTVGVIWLEVADGVDLEVGDGR